MFYLGIDVAKAKLDCCLLLDEAGGKRKTKVVPNSKAGIAILLEWTAKQNVLASDLHAIMEATCVYHEQAALSLIEAGAVVSVINPAQTRSLGRGLAVRTKTDKVDSFVLARCGALLKPEAWLPPPPEARMLSSLLTRRDAVAEDLRREKNRLEKAEAADTPPRVLQSILDAVSFHAAELKRLQQAVDDHIDSHSSMKQDMKLLTTIPAVGPQTGSKMLAVMKARHFQAAEQLAAYLGLVPVERQSGSSVLGRPRLSKTGPAKLRAVLYMAAVVALRHNPHVKAVYDRLLARGKSKMSALGAAMRKLVHLCFGVLKTRLPYQPNYAPSCLSRGFTS
ncbi:MAG: IS110 family transposase [Candidatus Electronema sp. V4]|uniref:IS110 family transposase n=1 Tax=Candidatus Electronema sp. V4 TaxID=3454756 RepID=UPI004055618E